MDNTIDKTIDSDTSGSGSNSLIINENEPTLLINPKKPQLNNSHSSILKSSQFVNTTNNTINNASKIVNKKFQFDLNNSFSTNNYL